MSGMSYDSLGGAVEKDLTGKIKKTNVLMELHSRCNKLRDIIIQTRQHFCGQMGKMCFLSRTVVELFWSLC